MSEILSINGLDAHYGLFQALYGIDMTVSEGEVIAIIGANGAGKTTLMRSVSGLIRNGAAQITYRGQHIGAMAPHDIAGLGIALVPEGRQLFPSLSVEENLMVGGHTVGANELKTNLERIFGHFPRLAERKGQAAGSLSGGDGIDRACDLRGGNTLGTIRRASRHHGGGCARRARARIPG